MVYGKFITVLDAGRKLSTVLHLRTTWCGCIVGRCHYKPWTGRLCWHFLQALLGNSRESWTSTSKKDIFFILIQDNTKPFENVESKLWEHFCHHPAFYSLHCKSFGKRTLAFPDAGDLIQLTLVLIFLKKSKASTSSIWSGFIMFRMWTNLVCSRWFRPTTMWLPGIKDRLD